jgi:integrase
MSNKNLIRKTYPRVRITTVKGQQFYVVDPRRQKNGKHIGGDREFFSSKKKALARADQIAVELHTEGSSSMSMDAALRVMALKGQALLKPFGKTVGDAIKHYHEFLKAKEAKESSETIATLANLWAEKKTSRYANKPLRQATKDDIFETRTMLKRDFGKLKILELERKHFEEYLDKLKVSQRRKYNIRSRFSQFFNWCIKQDIIEKNPLSEIVIEVPEMEVQILQPEEAKKIMLLCIESFSDLLAYHAVCLFAGIRPSEASQLEWKDIHIDQKTIHINAKIAKTKESRNVDIHPTLEAWLKYYEGSKRGCILNTPNNRSRLELFRAKLGYKIGKDNPNSKKWISDIMRHTFATFWLKTFNNRAHLSEIMGNSPSVIAKHYKAAVFTSGAEDFWNIVPPEQTK